MRSHYENLAEHYFRFAIRYPCWDMIENQSGQELWEAARNVLEDLPDEDVVFLKKVFSRQYANPQAGIMAYGGNRYKLQKRLVEIYELYAKQAGLI